MSLNPDIVWSLNNAGIGSIYHNQSLDDYGKAGKGLKAWMLRERAAVASGKGLILHGPGIRELMIMAARGFHMNGLGCYVTPLVRLQKVLYDAETRMQVAETQILVVTSLQTEVECPLKPSAVADTVALIEDRFARNKSCFLSIPMPTPTGYEKALAWWPSELADIFRKHCEAMTVKELEEGMS